MLAITRTRYIITCNDMILCHKNRATEFIPLTKLREAAIKSYSTEGKALSAFDKNYGWDRSEITVVEVTESVCQLQNKP